MQPLYTVRPISDRTGFPGPLKKGDRCPFTATWPQTERLLADELRHLGARDVVLELDVLERHIRVDGTLRADAKVMSTPGVRLAFVTNDGPLQFATDRLGWDQSNPPAFYTEGWKQNVRAIALGLSDLRRVDRYGLSPSGQQYRGFLAIEAGVPTSGMTTDVAWQVLVEESGGDGFNVDDPGAVRAAVKYAQMAAHPDRNNGDRSRWNALEQALQTLTRAGKL